MTIALERTLDILADARRTAGQCRAAGARRILRGRRAIPTAAARRKLDSQARRSHRRERRHGAGRRIRRRDESGRARHARGRRSPPAHVQDRRGVGRHRSRRAAPGRVAGALGVAMSRQEIAAHLRFMRELGVTGVSRDAAWREREGDPAPAAAPAAVADQDGRGAIDPVAEGSLTQIATLDALRAHIGPPARAASSARRAAGRSCSASAIRRPS